MLLFSVCICTGQEIFNPNNYAFDCTGRVVMPELNNIVHVYHGTDTLIETTELIFVTKASTAWEKKKADKNCLSANPEDCLVWCLIEVPGTEDIYNIVVDTSTTSDWSPFEYNIRPAGKKQEIPVVCKEDLSKELVAALGIRLYQLGYDIKPNKRYNKLKGKINKEFKKFQIDYDLPVGKWTRATMESLFESN